MVFSSGQWQMLPTTRLDEDREIAGSVHVGGERPRVVRLDLLQHAASGRHSRDRGGNSNRPAAQRGDTV